jgi:hypothetical protein
MTIANNYLDGFDRRGISAETSGLVTVARNTFGPKHTSTYTGAPGVATDKGPKEEIWESTTHGAYPMFDNYGAASNQRIWPWYPTAARVNGCAVEVDVTRVTSGSDGTSAPIVDSNNYQVGVTIDVYWTATTKAEVYVGSVSRVMGSGTITLPYYVTGAGNLRIQTQAAPLNGQVSSSQYSRWVPVAASPCGPITTLEQAAAQEDPTSRRNIAFDLRFSEPVDASQAAALRDAIGTGGSTGPNPVIRSVERLSPTWFRVTGRVGGTGTLVASLVGTTAVTAVGTPIPDSTSQDNEVTYLSPFSVSPLELWVHEGDPDVQFVTVTVSDGGPSAAIAVTPDIADLLALSPATVIAGPGAPGVIGVSAPYDPDYRGDTDITLTLSLVSGDDEFDGLSLPYVIVHFIEADPPPHATITKRAWIKVGAGPKATYAQIMADRKKTEVGLDSVLTEGTLVWWTYEVLNDGTGTLHDLVISDDALPGGDEVCVIAQLARGAREGCAASDQLNPQERRASRDADLD